MAKRVLVTGITGNQGGAVAQALSAKGFDVMGLTRNPTSPKAQKLAAQGIILHKGSFNDPDTLDKAMAKADVVFAMSTPFESGFEAEVAQGKALVDAALRQGVKHFVYTSVASADKATKIGHFDSKYEVEKYLRAQAIGWTIMAPVYFMENLFFPNVLGALKEQNYALAMPAAIPLQQVAVSEIGEFGAALVARGEKVFGQRIELASDSLSGSETARLLSETLGQAIDYKELPLEPIAAYMPDLARMYDWFSDVGYEVDIPKLKQEFSEVPWQGFGGWLGSSGLKEALA